MCCQPAKTEARVALRDATRSVHERLHVAPPFLALARGQLDIRGYAELLGRMAGYYFAVSEHLPIEPGRLRLLRLDVAAVDAPPFAVHCRLMPNSQAEALGWRYVVEGSIFGGRVIHRQLDYLFGREERGRSFFQGTAGGIRHWQALCAELEEAGSTPVALQQMIEGALDAFAVFETMIAESEPAHA